MVALAWHVHQMTVAEFLHWDSPDGLRYELVDGEPRLLAPTDNVQGILQAEIVALIRNYLRETGLPCVVLTNPGVIPDVLANFNFRIPDVGVSCARAIVDKPALPEPILLIEILSPSNKADTWSNVWTYTTIASVREVLVLHTSKMAAEVLRRSAEGDRPDKPATITSGNIELASIGFRVDLSDLFAQTGLAG